MIVTAHPAIGRLPLAVILSGCVLAGCDLGRRTVPVGGSVEISVPDQWRASPASEDGLGTNLWLFHGGYGAAVRVIVVPSTKLTPVAAAALLVPELVRYRYRFSAADLPSEDHGQDVALDYREPAEDETGLLLVRRLRSKPELIVIFVGVWPPRFDEPAAQELSDIADSARPARR